MTFLAISKIMAKPMKQFLTLLLVMTGLLTAQIKLAGLVVDANTKRQIGDVSVYIEGTKIGTVTDVTGKYSLDIPTTPSGHIVFQHISYRTLSFSADSLRKIKIVELFPRIIPLQGMEIIGVGEAQTPEIERDLPMRVAVLRSDAFDIRGYVDAGDVLKTDSGIQVQEEMSGKKTISLRGGNADDVLILYDGVRLNSPFDNVFDLSSIDLDQVERLEIIKGSNTILYGPEAFSGVINVVSQTAGDHLLRAKYRTGVYNTQEAGVSLFKALGAFSGSYGYKQISQERRFLESTSSDNSLLNLGQHHYANLTYTPKDQKITLLFSDSNLDYDNRRDAETDNRHHTIGSLRFSGKIGNIRDINVSTSLTRSDERLKIDYFTSRIQRDIGDHSLQFGADKTFSRQAFSLLTGYQFEQTIADMVENRLQSEALSSAQTAKIDRIHHGAFAIAKATAAAGGDFWQNIRFEGSARHDAVNDAVNAQTSTVPFAQTNPSQDNSWNAAHWKFSTSLDGYRRDLAFLVFLSYGGNTKFPTLVQQLSAPPTAVPGARFAEMRPEKISSVELGMDVYKEAVQGQPIDGWHLEGTLFRNYYEDKFRPYSTPGSPLLFFDNIPTAEIFGAEGGFTLHFFQKKMNLKFGMATYAVSDKSAFPFKSDFKRTLDWRLDHAGFSLLLHWFFESEQVGWLRTYSGELAEATLEPFSNIDVHISKLLRVHGVQFFINLSGMNLLNSDQAVLQGLAIRDRRAYLTAGFQF